MTINVSRDVDIQRAKSIPSMSKLDLHNDWQTATKTAECVRNTD